MASLLLLRDDFGDGDQDFDGEEPDAVLLVLGKMLEEGYHFFDDNGGGHFLDEFREIRRGLAADHGGFIVDEMAKLLAKLFLDGWRNLFVGGGVKTAT